ncbi:MAG: methylated-DNA-[protein]-cysteine S-methyltransferase, partial [Thermoleophilaceae bacterium]|nr:methylated-DNA-[protein]-cysteine S-methyltransferase [Thermoleophilaceae bacterium]
MTQPRLSDRLGAAARGRGLPAGALDRLAARAAGDGLLDVAYTTLATPVGDLLVAATPRGVVRISYLDWFPAEETLADLSRRVSPRVLEAPERLDDVRRELDEYFNGDRRGFDVRLDRSLLGPFAKRVLGRTAKIPYGKVSTYAEVAAGAGSPRASRAAGNALARNPIPIVIPCHRVLRSGGGMGGYAGGL